MNVFTFNSNLSVLIDFIALIPTQVIEIGRCKKKLFVIKNEIFFSAFIRPNKNFPISFTAFSLLKKSRALNCVFKVTLSKDILVKMLKNTRRDASLKNQSMSRTLCQAFYIRFLLLNFDLFYLCY